MNTIINTLVLSGDATVEFQGLDVPLVKPYFDWNRNNLSRFHFGARQTSLLGMEDEMKHLKSFCNSHNNFAWQAIHGDAGTGKSRLAFELGIYQSGLDWDFGFIGKGRSLEVDLSNLISNWHPRKSTLIIVDYTVFNSDLIATLIPSLWFRSEKWTDKVRLLLCDRTTDAHDPSSWYNRIRQEQSKSKSAFAAIEQSEFSSIMRCGAFSTRTMLTLSDIANEVLEKKYLVTDSKITSELLDERGIATPLHALIFADAFVNSPTSQLNYQQLEQWLLKYELKRWSQLGFETRDFRLLRTATLCGGLDISRLMEENLLESLNLPNDVEKVTRLFRRMNLEIIGDAGESGVLNKIEPDLIGELFALNDIIKFPHLEVDIQTASTIGKINEFVDFLRRAADYPQARSLALIISALHSFNIKPNQAKVLSCLSDAAISLSGNDEPKLSTEVILFLRSLIFSDDFRITIKSDQGKGDSALNYFSSAAIWLSEYRDKSQDIELTEFIDCVDFNRSFGVNHLNSLLLESQALIGMCQYTVTMNFSLCGECLKFIESLLPYVDIEDSILDSYYYMIFGEVIKSPDQIQLHEERFLKMQQLANKYPGMHTDTAIAFCLNLSAALNESDGALITIDEIRKTAIKLIQTGKNEVFGTVAFARLIHNWLIVQEDPIGFSKYAINLARVVLSIGENLPLVSKLAAHKEEALSTYKQLVHLLLQSDCVELITLKEKLTDIENVFSITTE